MNTKERPYEQLYLKEPHLCLTQPLVLGTHASHFSLRGKSSLNYFCKPILKFKSIAPLFLTHDLGCTCWGVFSSLMKLAPASNGRSASLCYSRETQLLAVNV